jgi:FMN phosphatase YigB (HAD superfamily)
VLFDLVVDSCEEGVRKPDRRIFELTLQRLGDVAAAAKVGLHAILVKNDHAPALDELRALVA